MRAPLSQFGVESPSSLEDALARMEASGGRLTPMAGGTDLYVYLNAGSIEPGRWIDIWGLDELRGIAEDKTHYLLGALTTYSQIRKSPVMQQALPLLVEAAATVGAVAIQNRGTLGGNIANGSPAGDSLPSLLVYDAEIDVRSVRGSRSVPFHQFYTGYRASVLAKDELIERIRIPKAAAARAGASRFIKVGTRAAQAISKVVGAFALHRGEDGKIDRCRVALGSVAPVPCRMTQVEDHLTGQTLDGELIASAVELLDEGIKPIDDIRSTARYRRFVSLRVFERFLQESRES